MGIQQPQLPHQWRDPDIDSIYDSNGVGELLNKLEPHKASGPGEIPAYFLYNIPSSLQQCSLPLVWKRANIVPPFIKVFFDLYLFERFGTHCI